MESLRSGLSKNAMILLGEMTQKLKRIMDSELDTITTKLLKKA